MGRYGSQKGETEVAQVRVSLKVLDWLESDLRVSLESTELGLGLSLEFG